MNLFGSWRRADESVLYAAGHLRAGVAASDSELSATLRVIVTVS